MSAKRMYSVDSIFHARNEKPFSPLSMEQFRDIVDNIFTGKETVRKVHYPANSVKAGYQQKDSRWQDTNEECQRLSF